MLRKRSLSLAGHTTSLALEPAFWDVLEAMAAGVPVVSTDAGSLAEVIGGADIFLGLSAPDVLKPAMVAAMAAVSAAAASLAAAAG